MNWPAKIAAWVLVLSLTGCFLHKTPKASTQPVAPPVTTASNVPPPTQQPPPELTIPTKPKVSDTKLPAQSPKPPARHKKSQPQPPSEPAETQQASVVAPAVDAIGVLSSGDPVSARQQTEQSLAATERSLNTLNRQLNDQEKKTATHIREFIKQAKAALVQGDVDGATTLAAKAKVLLQELVH